MVSYTITDVRINFQHAGYDHNALLEIYLKNEDIPIKVNSEMYWTYFTIDKTKESAAKVSEIYSELCEKTFKYRFQFYLDCIEEDGYFEYNNKKIFCDGSIIDSDNVRKINLFSDKPIIKQDNRIYFEKDKSSISKKEKPYWNKDDYEFSIYTNFDQDVFYYLMNKLFGSELLKTDFPGIQNFVSDISFRKEKFKII